MEENTIDYFMREIAELKSKHLELKTEISKLKYTNLQQEKKIRELEFKNTGLKTINEELESRLELAKECYDCFKEDETCAECDDSGLCKKYHMDQCIQCQLWFCEDCIYKNKNGYVCRRCAGDKMNCDWCKKEIKKNENVTKCYGKCCYEVYCDDCKKLYMKEDDAGNYFCTFACYWNFYGCVLCGKFEKEERYCEEWKCQDCSTIALKKQKT